MSHRSVNRFNQREVARAVRAMRLAGEQVERVDIDPRSGRISVIVAKPGGEEAHDSGAREWREAIERQRLKQKKREATKRR